MPDTNHHKNPDRPESFAEAMTAFTPDPSAAVATTGVFKLRLSSNGVVLGWMGRNGGDWAVLVSNEKDALTLELYPYGGVDYYRIQNANTRYLSVSDRNYVGFYNWLGARGWKFKGSQFISDYSGNPLALFSKDDAYLYTATNGYTVLDVVRVD